MLKATRRPLVVLFYLLSIAVRAEAMNEKEASGNMMYFAFAMKQAEQCEGMGFPGMSLVRSWEQKHGEVLVKSLRRVEDYAAATQKVTRDQAKDVALGLFIRHKESFDREIAPTLGKASCMRFGETLRMYETKLINE